MYNILILCNGQGLRFKNEEYLFPKPLINVFGTPIISNILNEIKKIENINLYIIYNSKFDHFQFKEKINHSHPNINISFLSMNDTSGPSETIYNSIKSLGIQGPFLTIDCDIIFSSDTILNLINRSRNEVVYFHDNGQLPQFSYLTHNNGIVSKIVEKKKISDFASCGIYSFSNPDVFISAFDSLQILDREICPSDIYTYLIESGISVFCSECLNYTCLGTPKLLMNYCHANKSENKKRFCFDVDNTLFKLNKNKDYQNVEIIEDNVNLLRNLYNDGHHIILHTSRNMKTYNNNIGEINKNTAPILFETLIKHDIPYHEIYFGKPVADFYIDDLAVNCFADIQKHTGFYYENS